MDIVNSKCSSVNFITSLTKLEFQNCIRFLDVFYFILPRRASYVSLYIVEKVKKYEMS